jgi:hypothetical protein
MAEDDAHRQIVIELHGQLQQSRQQEERLKDALTRVLKLVDEAKPPR